jgi:hypothetical protein
MLREGKNAANGDFGGSGVLWMRRGSGLMLINRHKLRHFTNRHNAIVRSAEPSSSSAGWIILVVNMLDPNFHASGQIHQLADEVITVSHWQGYK